MGFLIYERRNLIYGWICTKHILGHSLEEYSDCLLAGLVSCYWLLSRVRYLTQPVPVISTVSVAKFTARIHAPISCHAMQPPKKRTTRLDGWFMRLLSTPEERNVFLLRTEQRPFGNQYFLRFRW
jgi:hypothetical protein